MAGPNIGYATLTIIPTTKGSLGALKTELGDPLDKAGSEAGKTSSGKFGQSFKDGMKLAAGALTVAAAGAFLKGAVGAASDVAESMSKVKVVFGESADAVVDWSSTAASQLGISQAKALEASGTYGNLLKAFGLTGTEAQTMSTSMVDLAADLASFNNTSVDEALSSLQSGLTGETEPLKKFGIVLSDVRLKQEAMALGLISSTNEALTPAAKAQASYSLIMKDSALAQGDFARTSDGLANKQKILAAKFDDVKAKIGAALIPAMTTIVSVVTDKLLPALSGLFNAFKSTFNWLKNNQPVLVGIAAAIGVGLVAAIIAWTTATIPLIAAQIALGIAFLTAHAPIILTVAAIAALAAGIVWAYQNVDFFRTVVDALVVAFKATWSFVTDKLIPIFVQIIDVALVPVMAQFNIFKALVTDVLIPAFQAVWSFVADTLIPIIVAIATTFISIGQTVTRIVGEIVDVVLSIGGKIAGFVAAMWDGIKTGITVAKDWVGARIGDIVGFVTGIGGRIGSAISTMWDGLKTGITVAKDWVASRITEIVGFVTGIGGRIGDAVSNMWEGVKTGITTAKNWVKDRIDDIVGFATALPGRMSGSFVGMWDGIKSAFRSALNWVISHWNNLSFTIPSVSAFGVTLGGGSVGTPNIPLLHSGGIVPGAAGSDVLTMLQAGEYVIDRQSVNALMSQQRSAMPDRVTLVIEGEPFTARIQKRDRQLVGSLAAGRFTE